MTDRRPTAEDQRLTDIDSTEPGGRDESKKVGRVRLDEIDWEDAEPRRVPYEVWMERGSRPFPTRGRKDNWDDWPDVPTRVDGWRFRDETTENGYLVPGYIADASAFPRDLRDGDTYVEFDDSREFGDGISAYVVTPDVRVAAGAPAHPPIVEADDPDTFVRRVVSYLDGTPPDEIRHPRFDDAIVRNLPDNWEFNRLLPLSTKTTYTWSGEMIDNGRATAWAIDAEGSTTSGRPMDVFAYPVPSLGEKAPRVRPDDMGIDPMPGPGPGPAAETARRMMRWLNENPAELAPKGTGTDTPDEKAARDSLSFTDADGGDIEFFVGDRVRTVYNDTRTDRTETIGGVLSGWRFEEPERTSTDDKGPLVIEVDNTDSRFGVGRYTIRGREVIFDRKVGEVLPGKLPIYLTQRGD